MEVLSPPHLYRSMKLYLRRRKYQKLDGSGKRNVRVARLGGNVKRSWKVRVMPRLRLKLRVFLPSPVKILARLRDAYVDVMLRFGGKAGALRNSSEPSFGVQKVPKSKSARVTQSSIEDFESRLMLEIYKSIVACRELAELR
eukprot:TRINITY_DN3707_c0_g2_i1.p1 TRINITY_DN3707_c0_g2~~TRINITY_DN3707_c0_g2_i1.p1  ORF type:complete len:142 (+),score=21.44 TRINITY_DN3707_c0_g2_i1:176-601(+)